jgi:hypothetical protein
MRSSRQIKACIIDALRGSEIVYICRGDVKYYMNLAKSIAKENDLIFKETTSMRMLQFKATSESPYTGLIIFTADSSFNRSRFESLSFGHNRELVFDHDVGESPFA